MSLALTTNSLWREQVQMNLESKYPPRSKQSSTFPWLLRFGFFLLFFAVIALLVSYGIISLKGTDNTANSAPQSASQPAGQPAPTAQSNEPPVLPSGTAGHAAATPTPQR
jgi:hypothetical protein